jgi:DNA (cytosine-5)-methyltransferase 1
MKKTVIELFAGVGGFRVGLNNIKQFNENGLAIESPNWNFVWANQWEPSSKSQPAFECYTTRFGNSNKHVNKDISTIDSHDIPTHNLLVGGFPCQDYSVARSLSKEKGIEGKKGVLWWEIYRIIKDKKPPFVLLENVDRLLKSPSKQRGRDFGVMLRGLNDLGYGVEWRVINAADYGMPQRRRRVFIFAFHNSTNYFSEIKGYDTENMLYKSGFFSKSFPVTLDIHTKHKPLQTHLTHNLKEIFDVSDNFNFTFRNSGIMIDGQIYTHELTPVTHPIYKLNSLIDPYVDEKYYLTNHQIGKFEYLKNAKRIERIKPNGEPYFYSEGSMAFPDNLSLPGRTMLTSESSINRSTHVIQDKKGKLRTLTPIEAERLNTFPDNWTNTGMSDKQRFFMMGNALVCDIIRTLSLELNLIFEKEN